MQTQRDPRKLSPEQQSIRERIRNMDAQCSEVVERVKRNALPGEEVFVEEFLAFQASLRRQLAALYPFAADVLGTPGDSRHEVKH